VFSGNLLSHREYRHTDMKHIQREQALTQPRAAAGCPHTHSHAVPPRRAHTQSPPHASHQQPRISCPAADREHPLSRTLRRSFLPATLSPDLQPSASQSPVERPGGAGSTKGSYSSRMKRKPLELKGCEPHFWQPVLGLAATSRGQGSSIHTDRHSHIPR